MGWEEKIDKARKEHRPSLKDWQCDGLAEVFPSFVSSLSDEYQSLVLGEEESESSNKNGSKKNSDSSVNRWSNNLPMVLDAATLTCSEFASEYEIKRIPCVIHNISAGYENGVFVGEWQAVRKWALNTLENDPILKKYKFKCGEDDEGYSIKVKLKHFLKYLHSNTDDSPLYVFDRSFEDDDRANRLLDEYRVPEYFREDLFGLCRESARPPYRWFLIGPERSGTTVHVDPLATSAWNTLISGKKRWVLFPPHVPKSVVKGRGLIRDDEDDEAIHYFMYILPRIKRTALRASSCTNNDDNSPYKNFACYEFTQKEGETVFIPHGWWHAVLNLTHTVGVTQNYCSERNFDDVWVKTRSGRKKLAWKWLLSLDKNYPHLAARARQMNERDEFEMKYDPAVIQRRSQNESDKDISQTEAGADDAELEQGRETEEGRTKRKTLEEKATASPTIANNTTRQMTSAVQLSSDDEEACQPFSLRSNSSSSYGAGEMKDSLSNCNISDLKRDVKRSRNDASDIITTNNKIDNATNNKTTTSRPVSPS